MNTKRYFSIAAALLLCGSISAQTTYYNTRHEVGVTIGTGTVTELFSGIAQLTEIGVSAALTTAATVGNYTAYYTYGSKSYIPTISVEYYYHVNKVIGVGGYVAFNGMTRDMYFEWTENGTGTQHKDMVGKGKLRNVSLIPTVKFDWLRKKHFGLYSKAGFGMSIMYESQKGENGSDTDYTDTSVIPNFEATLIGAEVGSETWRGFAEYGVGEQGMLCAGLRYKF